jgi:hypothetical protein
MFNRNHLSSVYHVYESSEHRTEKLVVELLREFHAASYNRTGRGT